MKSGSWRALGLDLGGSSIKIAVVAGANTKNPEVLVTEVREIHPSRAPKLVVIDLTSIVEDYGDKYGPFDSVGLALPGLHDEQLGTSTLLPNFPDEWRGFPVREELFRASGVHVTLVNDARAFAVAESVLGAAVGLETVVCLVLGTGVGGGVVHKGKLWRGQGTAGEIGHQTVELDGPLCGCGNYGCVEAIAGSTAIISNGGKPTVKEVFQAAAAGDVRAKKTVDRAVSAIGAGLANAYLVLAPDAFVLGGGVAESGSQLFDPLVDEIRRRVTVASDECIRILPAKLGIFAGAVGSALLGADRN